MSKIASVVKKEKDSRNTIGADSHNKAVKNFMSGISYEVNPLLTLKMVTASSIFGEPQYYREGELAEKNIHDGTFRIHPQFMPYSVLLNDKYANMSTSQIMEVLIDKALTHDFMNTLLWAKELRQNYNMRLNPQVIMVRAAMHPLRANFTKQHPGLFNQIEQSVMARGDEPASQFAYYLFKNKGISGLPNLLKKAWANKISKLTRYEFAKYKNKGLGLIDTIRVSHAKGPLVDELLITGTIELSDESELTWERLRAEGKTWSEIITTIRLPHMALLRNLRGIFGEIKDDKIKEALLSQLEAGVIKGKQFPFSYKVAAEMIQISDLSSQDKDMIKHVLSRCVDISVSEMPRLKGKTMNLSDNSGSAHGAFVSEFGRVSVANIGNLSSVITAKNSDEGYVGVFGDKLSVIPVHGQCDTLRMAEMADMAGKYVGSGTEHGVWLFFRQAIETKEHWDNIFIYSDMQAGHGGLYGFNSNEYQQFLANGRYIDVAKLVDTYRKEVNPKVNVFMVQTAGYTNVLVPEYGYRTNVLYGWTGKELLFADKMIQLWDEYDNSNKVA